ncbi:hypothetical protein [Psychroserpens luteus]|uniref:Uncharacterized protein n=1 Tax=Psychroserpens luteus TaxID=1434066 RepID=A0ABW5ZTZ0_9FLAO|nr:hypothetical protein [Psychroserpens luteus]
MTDLLKKYLLIKWWFPLLFFLISCLTLYLTIGWTNRIISEYFFWLTAVILFISTIWQFTDGKWYLSILQFSVLIVPTVAFAGLLILGQILNEKSEPREWTKNNMIGLIQEKTDLKLSENFKIITDSVQHTEGAFDSDYSYELIIEYQELEEIQIKEQIKNSVLFDTINTRYNPKSVWKIIDSKTDKGIWTYYNNGFEFLHCDNHKNRPEPFYFTIDTLKNKIELNLQHL